jgi:hypothetical protein
VLIIGTCGVAGYAVIRADHVAGHRDGMVHAGLPSHGVQNLRPGGDKSSTGIRVWIGSYPRRELNSEHEPGALSRNRNNWKEDGAPPASIWQRRSGPRHCSQELQQRQYGQHYDGDRAHLPFGWPSRSATQGQRRRPV